MSKKADRTNFWVCPVCKREGMLSVTHPVGTPCPISRRTEGGEDMKAATIKLVFPNQAEAAEVLHGVTSDPRVSAHCISAEIREADSEEASDYAGRQTFCKLLSDWWCPHCWCAIPPEDVTYEERHAIERGGCGGLVLSAALGEGK